jgi:hypothetical protein
MFFPHLVHQRPPSTLKASAVFLFFFGGNFLIFFLRRKNLFTSALRALGGYCVSVQFVFL